MNRVFLGRWWHWAILAAIVGLLWLAGAERLHVVHFNGFVLALLAGTVVVLGAVVLGTRPGEQVTRDPIEPPPEDGAGS